MREFVVKKGKFEGIHKIYNDAKELLENTGISFIRKPWSHPEARSGEWCYMDDGFIMQLLHHGELISKKTGKKVETYRFPIGSRAVYLRKRDNTRVAPLLYSTNPSVNKSALVTQGYDRAIGGSYDSRKKLWVNLVADGLEPLEATRVVYKGLKPFRIVSVTNKLIENDKIKEMVISKMVPFKEELEKQIKLITGGTLLEAVSFEIAKLIGADSKSIKDLSTKIKTLLDVARITGDIRTPDSKSKLFDAQETDFKEIIPPALGTS